MSEFMNQKESRVERVDDKCRFIYQKTFQDDEIEPELRIAIYLPQRQKYLEILARLGKDTLPGTGVGDVDLAYVPFQLLLIQSKNMM
ncbi:hypothetical protein CDAR_66911 [Caerostris darwini]|uniref:Uncharacterized protein n=1 Tax=Caerostris darwini TaxID=1538125 RepID=A0AAV4QVJ9_9ARAC|nr:hypothetical protein CDAR_66911 [Caerostris darwini]